MSQAARLVFPSLRWRSRTGFAHERAKIDQTLKLGVGGYILFGGDAASARALVRDLQAASPHPLLIGADFERGAAQQFAGLTDLPPPAALGFLGDPRITARCGIVTAQEARYAGVNWVYAPDSDLDIEPENPIIQTRSFGDDPQLVSGLVSTWIRAAEEAGVATAAKHYPGHGRTTADSHDTLPTVPTPKAQLAESDLIPFAAAVHAGARSVMTAHVAYPDWDGSGLPATLSPEILGYLRRDLAFDGVIVTDALIMEGALKDRGAPRASVAAVAAGCDALLYPNDPAAVARALDQARRGELAPSRLDEAIGRITRLATEIAAPSSEPDPTAPDLAADRAFADAVADIAVHLLRGDSLGLNPPFRIAVVDDDVGGPYVVGPRYLFANTLRGAGVPLGPGGGTIVLIYAEPRSWKGHALLSANSVQQLGQLVPPADLVILFGHPRIMGQMPDGPPVVCAWHGQPLMQRAAARWVMGRLA